MKEVLDNLSEKYCPSCEVGAAGREVGYLAPGSCIDYAYDELSVYIYIYIYLNNRLNILSQLKYSIKILISHERSQITLETLLVSYRSMRLQEKEEIESNRKCLRTP